MSSLTWYAWLAVTYHSRATHVLHGKMFMSIDSITSWCKRYLSSAALSSCFIHRYKSLRLSDLSGYVSPITTFSGATLFPSKSMRQYVCWIPGARKEKSVIVLMREVLALLWFLIDDVIFIYIGVYSLRMCRLPSSVIG